MDENLKQIFLTHFDCYAWVEEDPDVTAMTMERFLEVCKLYGMTPTKTPNPQELQLMWNNPIQRLEYLRGEIEAERISQGEILELQSLAIHIKPGDVLLLEWAGVPERMTPKRQVELDEVANSLMEPQHPQFHDGIEMCVYVSKHFGDELTLAEAEYVETKMAELAEEPT